MTGTKYDTLKTYLLDRQEGLLNALQSIITGRGRGRPRYEEIEAMRRLEREKKNIDAMLAEIEDVAKSFTLDAKTHPLHPSCATSSQVA